MRLSQLIPNADTPVDPDITAIVEDSRRAVPGALFISQRGKKTSGDVHILEAVHNGAVAVALHHDALWPSTLDPQQIAVVRTHDGRILVSQLASAFYPAQPDTIVAVTGTSGKTSTAHFTQQLFSALDLSSVSLGTLGLRGAVTKDGTLTTPEAADLHATLNELYQTGITHVAMEASSQALHQYRLENVHIKAAGFTNLSHDHLDYHETLDDYFAAKKRLFSDILPEGGTAVLNSDIPQFKELAQIAEARGCRVMSYGRAGVDFKLIEAAPKAHGQILTFEHAGETYTVTLPIAGMFQAWNVLCALGLVLAVRPHRDAETLLRFLNQLQPPPGRLQAIENHPNGAAIYVDYAHKPDALEQVLRALRPHTAGKLVCLFGCGGDRDASKRPIMGRIAAKLADRVIVTDDNPRTENPTAIRAAILAASPGAVEIADRRAAIRTAIHDLAPDDVLVIAGKGHETGQKFATHTEPFNDVEEATAACRALMSP